jgi:hypothetical protein
MVQMNKKQQIAIFVMALYFIVTIASNLTEFWLTEEEIFRRILDEGYIDLDPNLQDLEYENLRELSSQLESYIKGKTLISLVNLVLLLYLFASYLDIYRNTKAKFTLGLMFLCGALLSYSLFSNPILLSFNSRADGLQIIRSFNVIPDIFTTLASTILIYLNRQ